jgi:hypothetical protein
MNEDVQKFLLGLIEPEVWDRAVWIGCAFIFDEGQPPIMAFIFQRAESAREVFAGLRAFVGPDDEESLLRICIIEGRFDGNDSAYGVSVGPNYANVLRHFGQTDETIDTDHSFTLSRFLRMTPKTLDPLKKFKNLFQRFGVFTLMPAVASGNSVTPFDEIGIVKRNLVLRKQSDIRYDNDEDAVALQETSPR